MTPRAYWIGDTLWEENPSTDTLTRVWSPSRIDELCGSLTLTWEGLEALGAVLVAVA